ncbi:MAG: response regulator transcription factor [Clostridiales bacterium]|jgi:DNA-binding response OmpR family regulator|nr:response regulator transcription factor [Clostridiales bacterium]
MFYSANNSKTILLVEDNEQLNDINCRALKREGYNVLSALNVAQARDFFAKSNPDAIILDIMLPDGSGVEFCREIRERTAAPILFLTSVNGHEQTLKGLAAGGDDYLNKPFDLNILTAKVSAFLRRDEIAGRVRNEIKKGQITLDITAVRAYLNGTDMLLSQTEFALLLLFIQNENKTLTSDEIYEKVWVRPMLENDTSLKNALSRLRKKIAHSGYQISAVRGHGYCFMNE